MKNIPYLIGALIIGSITACTPPIITQTNYPSQQPQPQPQVDNTEVTDQTFYDDLAPDGRWINDPQIGYVWSPNVGADFRPYYTNGHWNYTNYGWTWVSDYRWGWATFHYGRWKYDTAYGWVWAPGHEWGPAWVQWRKTPDSYGWAPLEPGISIEVGFSSGYHIPENHWAFVPQQHIADRNFRQYAPPVQQNNVYINKSTIINNNITINNIHTTTINNVTNNATINNNDNRKYIGGPNVHEVENVTNQKVQVYNIQNGARPGTTTESNNAINIYRPHVKENGGNQGGNNPVAPKTVYPYRQNDPTRVMPTSHQLNSNGNDNSQPTQTIQNPNNQETRRNNQNSQNNQTSPNTQPANQQQEQPHRRDNNITTQPINPAVSPQKQDVPLLNPAENQHRTPGDVTPNSPNNNLPRQPQQPRKDKNEQTIPAQQPTPQPVNRNPNQNSSYQQRQNAAINPNNVPITQSGNNQNPQNQPWQNQPQNTTPVPNQPVNQNPRQPFQNNNQNNNSNNPNYNRPMRTQPANQTPQQQPVINKSTPATNQPPAQNNRPVVQPQTRQNDGHVRTPAVTSTPATTPPQPKKEDNKPAQQQ